MSTIVVLDTVLGDIFDGIKKYLLQNPSDAQIRKNLGVTRNQLLNLYQQVDVGGPYRDFDDMYRHFNREPGTKQGVTITPRLYKNLVMLMLGYHHGFIKFI
jgi:hypothetical protein